MHHRRTSNLRSLALRSISLSRTVDWQQEHGRAFGTWNSGPVGTVARLSRRSRARRLDWMGLSAGNCDLSRKSRLRVMQDKEKRQGLGLARESTNDPDYMRSSYGSRSSTHILRTIPSSHTIEGQYIHSSIFCTRPQAQNKLEKRKLCNADKRKSHASHLSLLQATLCHTLRLVDLGGVTGGLEGVAGGGQGLQVSAVLFVGLERGVSNDPMVAGGKTVDISAHTKGTPQYPQVAISGLSVLMKTLGWPRGPPPPSQLTTLDFVQRTGCL